MFDGGYISFFDEGDVLVVNEKIKAVMEIWALDCTRKVGSFTMKQKQYLHYHREQIFAKRRSLLKEPDKELNIDEIEIRSVALKDFIRNEKTPPPPRVDKTN
jgi:hypothetical protein